MYRVKQEHWLLSTTPYGDVFRGSTGNGEGVIWGHLGDYLGKAQSVEKNNFESS